MNKVIKAIPLQVFISSASGNILEFYDFATYGFLMPLIAPLFFPSTNPINSFFMACGAFTISFLARPIGGLLFGYIGDIYGRKTSFSLSLFFMAIATTLIGILPTYEKVGLLAPLLLILCRILQGLCLGGEFSGSLIFAVEHHNPLSRKSALITSTITSAGVSGWFLSSLTCSICTNYGGSWRIPFLLGAVVGIIGFYIRWSVPEAPVQQKALPSTLWKSGKEEWRTVFAIIGIGSFMGGIFYGLHILPNSLLPFYFPLISQSQALQCTSIGIGTYMVFLPLMGWISDRISHVKIMQLFSFLTIFLSYYIITLLMSGNFLLIIFAEFLASILLAGFMAPATFVMAQSFLPSIRYRLVSFSYNIGASLVGGLTPGILLFLFEQNKIYGPGMYIAICGIVGLLSSFVFKLK